MEILNQLGVALGLASLAGLNLYLTVFVAGLAIQQHWINLSGAYENLSVLGNPWVIGVAGVLFAIEFFADKVPWVDSTWDSVHTLIRPAGGIFLALAALGHMKPEYTVVAALIAGGAALTTHGAKAGTRLVLNTSPEPVTNSIASFAEDGIVLGGLSLIHFAPIAALVVFTVFIIICLVLVRWLWKKTLGRKKTEALAA